jgi:cytochrome c553
MPMKRWVICAVLSVVALEVAGNGTVIGASDGGPQNTHKIGPSGSVPVRPAGDSSRGEGLYNASCIVCHSLQATGGIGPRLAGNPVLSNEQAFWKVVYEGRHVMPPLKDAITEQQMADIQAWLKTLR